MKGIIFYGHGLGSNLANAAKWECGASVFAYLTPAIRPTYSVLSKGKIHSLLDYDIPHWRESLHAMLVHNLG